MENSEASIYKCCRELYSAFLSEYVTGLKKTRSHQNCWSYPPSKRKWKWKRDSSHSYFSHWGKHYSDVSNWHLKLLVLAVQWWQSATRCCQLKSDEKCLHWEHVCEINVQLIYLFYILWNHGLTRNITVLFSVSINTIPCLKHIWSLLSMGWERVSYGWFSNSELANILFAHFCLVLCNHNFSRM